MLALLLCLCAVSTMSQDSTAPIEQQMTNADVIALIEAGLGPELVIKKIRGASAAEFDTTTGGLVALKKNKVPDDVIEAMLAWAAPASRPSPSPSAALTPTPTNEETAPAAQPGRMSRVKSRLKSAVTRESEEEERQQEAAEKQQDATAIGRSTDDPCVKNFLKGGSFVVGYKFTTFADVTGTTRTQAFDVLIAQMAGGGWQVVSSSREAGVISANQGVIGSGKTIPFNITITGSGSGVRVQLVVQLGSGMLAPSNAIQKEFCDFIDAVRR
ncbi:MAG: hypothetical protein WA208_18625 [Thermoanaerobaculia bacterium]